ncbi:PEGA domain-containing protein [Kiritimatiellota bacterium B12222]|nr:PEGA domain-containing protein [Kiritimatiellota bacterium B12222]
MKKILIPFFAALLLLSGCELQKPAPTGELFVMTQPADAVVEVNGEILGPSPLQHNVASGNVLITLRKEGYETEWHSLHLTTGEREVLDSTMRPIKGLMVINSTPQGAAVSIGEVFAGNTPLTLHEIGLGTHRARLVMSGFDDKEIEFSVTDRIPQALNVDLNSNAGVLVVLSNPTGATVFVDGRNEGTTPLSLDQIAKGQRDVLLQYPGHEPYRQNVLIAASDTTRIDATLTPLPGGLSVISIPGKARVYVDGEFTGEAPVTLKNLAPGAHNIRVESRGHAEESRTVQIERGENSIEEFRLERNSGTLQIITRPAGVNVNINGEFMGKTRPGADGSDVVSSPLMIDMLSQGSHTLQLVREGYTFQTKRFFITKDQVTTLEETLERKFIPNTLLRLGNGEGEVITGVLLRRHPGGDVEMEIRKGVFRTFPSGSYISIEPLKQAEEVDVATPAQLP